MSSEKFPFALDDLIGWVIRRKDGTSIRYNLITAESLVKKTPVKTSSFGGNFFSAYSAREWCDHEPHPGTNEPVFLSKEHNIALYIADSPGARKCYKEFDVCIDGGGVLSVPGEHDLPNIYGDPKLKAALLRHVHSYGDSKDAEGGPKIIKLRWFDRCPPPVWPSFWPALLEELKKLAAGKKNAPLNVLTICQGGHGRSGSALVLLMMCMTNYTPLDALTHIRAVHCARAIESKDQHVYLNSMAKVLGRDENALDAETVPSFRDRFLASSHPEMARLHDRVNGGKGAKVTDREGSYL